MVIGENINLKFPNISADNKLRILNEYTKDTITLVKSLTDENTASDLAERLLHQTFEASNDKPIIEQSNYNVVMQDYHENPKSLLTTESIDSNIQIVAEHPITIFAKDNEHRTHAPREFSALDLHNINVDNTSQNGIQSSRRVNQNSNLREIDPALNILQNLKLEIIEDVSKKHDEPFEVSSHANLTSSVPVKPSIISTTERAPLGHHKSSNFLQNFNKPDSILRKEMSPEKSNNLNQINDNNPRQKNLETQKTISINQNNKENVLLNQEKNAKKENFAASPVKNQVIDFNNENSSKFTIKYKINTF